MAALGVGLNTNLAVGTNTPAATSVPATATSAALVAGTHAQAGPSGKQETVVALHHPHTKHWLVASADGKLSSHHHFNAPNNQSNGRHHGHFVLEHHGDHHKIRSSHGHYLHHSEAGNVHLSANAHPHNSKWQFIADEEAKKHHLQGANGQYFQVSGDPPEPVLTANQSAQTQLQVTSTAAAAANPNPSGK